MIQDGVVTVQGNRITAIGPKTPQMTSFTYDLGDSTLLPGMIDVHVHLNWYFGQNGKYGQGTNPAGYVGKAVQENAAATLMAGVTEAVVIEPPETGAGGRRESPSVAWMRSTGSPRASAATCVIVV